MTTVERLGTIAGIILSVLAVVGALESFTNVSLFWKLAATGFGALILSLALGRPLAEWTRTPATIGFYQQNRWTSAVIVKFIFACLTLAAVSGFLVFVAWLATERLTLQLKERRTAQSSISLLMAAYPTVSSVTIQLPTSSVAACQWRDVRRNSFPRMDVQVVDWDTVTPKLHIDDFSHPQQIAIECTPPVLVRNIEAEPSSAKIYLTNELERLRYWIFGAGVVIWLVGSFRIWWLSP